MVKKLRDYLLVTVAAIVCCTMPNLAFAEYDEIACNQASWFRAKCSNDYASDCQYGSGNGQWICDNIFLHNPGISASRDLCIAAIDSGDDTEWCGDGLDNEEWCTYTCMFDSECAGGGTCTNNCCANAQCPTWPNMLCTSHYDCTVSGFTNCDAVTGCCVKSSGGTSGGGDNPSNPSGCAAEHYGLEFIEDQMTEGPQAVCGSMCGSGDSACIGTTNGFSAYGAGDVFQQIHCDDTHTAEEDGFNNNDGYIMIEYCDSNPCGEMGFTGSNKIESCDVCADGYDRVSITGMRGMEQGRDYILDSDEKIPNGIFYSSSVLDSGWNNFYVCVQCNSTTNEGSWEEYTSVYQIKTTTYTYHPNCNRAQQQNNEYRCAENYYSRAGLDSADNVRDLVCAQCPEHSESCSRTGFECASGYYRVGWECMSCPENATCPDGGNGFICNQNYYKSGDGCVACPDSDDPVASTSSRIPGLTDASGKTSVLDCYQSNSTVFKDATGEYQLVGDGGMCFYTPPQQ